MRTVLSEEQVARRGRVGWGAVSQAREWDGESRVARLDIWRGVEAESIVKVGESVVGPMGGREENY